MVLLLSIYFTLKLERCNIQTLDEENKFSIDQLGFSVEQPKTLVFKFEKLSFSIKILVSR